MKVRARNVEGVTGVRILMRHDMETGRRKDSAGAIIPAHYIQSVTVKHGQRVVLFAQWGRAVSRNPYLAFKFMGGTTGDRIEVTWVDNKGDSRTDENIIT
jgi:sulfur-oxidizing protein SoxZ